MERETLASGRAALFHAQSPHPKGRGLRATAKEAWRLYGLSNGTDSESELVRKIELFASKRSKSFTISNDPIIGCIELAEVVTLEDTRLVSPEECGHSFPKEVVKLKYFDEPDAIAARIDMPTCYRARGQLPVTMRRSAFLLYYGVLGIQIGDAEYFIFDVNYDIKVLQVRAERGKKTTSYIV